MGTLLREVRQAVRRLARSPGFTAVAVLLLALGIGANTAIFSVVDAVLLRPLPYDDPERLVLVWDRMERSTIERAPLSGPAVADFQLQAESFSGLAATNNVSEAALAGDGRPEQIRVANVTPNFFTVLGVAPRLGRGFEEADGAPFPPGTFQSPTADIPPTAMILTHGLWQRRFGGDPEITGRAVRVGGAPMTVVGVLPPGFELLMPPDAGMPTDIDAFLPLRLDLATQPRDNQFLRVIGRLAPGITVEAAQQEMAALAARQREEHAFHRNMGIDVDVRPLHRDAVSHARPVLLALLAAVGFVLLIACANVANLMLARAAGRRREMAVRAALGASRWQLFRQVLLEGLLLALAGAAAGMALALLGVRLLVALQPPDLPRTAAVAIDGRLLAFTLAATTVAALLAALAPALSAALARSREALGERSGTGGGLRLRGALVVAEVALSLVLLIGAGLMLRTFVELSRIDPGFDPSGALTFKLQLPFTSYGTVETRTAFHRDLERSLAEKPGVEAVGGVFPMPLGGRLWTGPFGLTSEPEEDWTEREADFRVVTPGYFDAMGIRVESGRGLEPADVEEQREVAVVDVALARLLWGERSPLGERIGIDLFGTTLRLEVVGVVRSVRHKGLTDPIRETVYFPHHFFPWTPLTTAVRATGDPGALAAAVRGEVAERDAELPVYAVRPLGEYFTQATAAARFTMVLAALFAAVALVLAAVGLAGLLAYGVRSRTREIGVRVALGARPVDVSRLVVGRGLLLVGAGLVLGLGGAVAMHRGVAGLLHGVSATDPGTYAALTLVLGLVALVACWLPARRASRIDPAVALRSQ